MSVSSASIPITANSQYIDENGFLRTNIIGDQTVEGINATFQNTIGLIAKIKAAGKPILLINNLLNIGAETAATRKATVDGFKSIGVDRVAMITRNTAATRYGTNFIMMVTGQGNITRFFETEEEGLAFLGAFKPKV